MLIPPLPSAATPNAASKQIVTELRNLHAQDGGAGAHFGINVKKVRSLSSLLGVPRA